MSLENIITIGKHGITGAIKQKLIDENISVKNFDISVWQEIMDAIKDDEDFKKIYKGSTNLKDKNAFLIAKETTVKLSESLWNTILNIAKKHNGTEIKSEQPNIIQNEQKTTPLSSLKNKLPNLPFTENGDIDFKLLKPENLKLQFPEEEYEIECFDDNNEYYIRIINKQNSDVVFNYDNSTTWNGDNVQIISFKDNGQQTDLIYTNNQFETKRIFNEDGSGFVMQHFSNGILYEETIHAKKGDKFERTETKKILSDKLIQDIKKRIKACEDGIGFLPKTDDIEQTVLQGITSNNILSICSDYNITTGNNLIQDIIDNKMGLGYEQQKELVKHLTAVTRDSYASKNDDTHFLEGESIGYEIQLALEHNDKELLKQTLHNINKENILYALTKIYKVEENRDFSDYSDKLYTQLLQMLGEDAGEYITIIVNSMIQNIYEKGGYCKDLVEDLNSHLDNFHKSAIDFTRLANRCKAGQTSTVTGKANGKIDINNIQQKGTGDCWLLAPILSAANKNQKGLDYINSMLSVNKNGDVTVELKGINKKYVITAEEIEKSNHLASGDPDIRAIEIAVDKYMKELAYESTDNENLALSHADINGDRTDFAYKILFGNGYCCEEPDIMTDDYNSENHIYSLAFGEKPNLKATVLGSSSTKTQTVDLIGNHAYAIKSSDEKYIYLINPHNSAELLQIEREELKNKNARTYMALIDMNVLFE